MKWAPLSRLAWTNLATSASPPPDQAELNRMAWQEACWKLGEFLRDGRDCLVLFASKRDRRAFRKAEGISGIRGPLMDLLIRSSKVSSLVEPGTAYLVDASKAFVGLARRLGGVISVGDNEMPGAAGRQSR